jgi:hypothetical protein
MLEKEKANETKTREGGQVVQASESDRLLTNVRRGDEVRTSGGEQACTQCQRVAHTHEAGGQMTAQELYDLLDKAGVEFEVVEIFEGLRTLTFVVKEDHDD